MRLPRDSRSRARVAAAILGLIVAPIFIALGETVRGRVGPVCFVAAAVAAIAAVALIADSLEVNVDPRSRARSNPRSSPRMPVRKRRHAGPL